MTRATDGPFNHRTEIPVLKRLNVQIPSELHRRLKVEAAAREQSITEMVSAIVSASLRMR